MLEKTGKSNYEFIMIGDRELDILAAQGAGVKGCLFTNGKENVETVAEYKINEFLEFFDKVAEVNAK